jgi:transposase InsO family protein
LLCRFLKVSRSGYYDWLDRKKSDREKQDQDLKKNLKVFFLEGREIYGSRRLKQRFAQTSITVSRRRISRLMKEENLFCKTAQRIKATTDSNHKKPIADNLLQRQFKVMVPNRYWVGDISYIPTQEGWLYLAIVIDLYSRKVVGWSMSDRLKAELVNNALLMAIWRRKPAKGLIWHTDQGSQYAAHSHRKILKQHHLIQSMSRKGDCWDNAVAESFFHTLKTELTHHHTFKTRQEARNAIFEYIEVFYNRIRIHSTTNYCSPENFESLQKIA